MADSFQPVFADLVRNYTTTTGTADFKLGAAANGFTGFATALQPGDSFYYSAIGVDKPAEREVGRGTLGAGGTISRDPVSGTKTTFTSGTKTVSLIAAAEWFTGVGAGGGASTTAATRSALAGRGDRAAAVFLAEPGREGLFRFDSADLSAKVAADPRQAVHIAPASDPTGAAGAWVRMFSGSLDVSWFGAVGDNVTDDLPAFQAAVAFAKATATNADQNGNVWKGGPSLYVPPPRGGMYFLGAPLELKGVSLTVHGDITEWGMFSPTLRFAANSDGIIVHLHTTSGAGVESPATGSSQQSVIRGLRIKGSGTSLTSKGVWRRGKAALEDVFVEGFGYGDYIDATSGAVALGLSAAEEGNANGWSNLRVRCASNRRSGKLVRGADANAGTDMHGDYSYNGEWGVEERSFLGNSYYSCHRDRNGTADIRALLALTGSCCVSHGGNLYACIAGKEALAATTAPGSDASVWTLLEPGGSDIMAPAWSSAMSVTSGGAMCVVGPNNASKIDGGYCEGTHGPVQLTDSRAMIDGGFNNAAGVLGGPQTFADAGSFGVNAPVVSVTRDYGERLITPANVTTAQLGGPAGERWILSATHPVIAPVGYQLKFRPGHLHFSYANSDVATNIPFTVYAPGNASGEDPHLLGFRAISLGDWQAGNNRQITVDTGAPASGTHNRGKFIFNRDPARGGAIGWRCLTYGTPGTWEMLCSGLNSVGVGYVTGAGGAATQATSKSTTVTLNKLCGQITTAAAALAAGAVVEFTVANSQVAATDLIRLNLASGPAASSAYRYWVSGVAAGSFKVAIENRSAGSLSEALVLNFAVLKAVNA